MLEHSPHLQLLVETAPGSWHRNWPIDGIYPLREELSAALLVLRSWLQLDLECKDAQHNVTRSGMGFLLDLGYLGPIFLSQVKNVVSHASKNDGLPKWKVRFPSMIGSDVPLQSFSSVVGSDLQFGNFRLDQAKQRMHGIGPNFET